MAALRGVHGKDDARRASADDSNALRRVRLFGKLGEHILKAGAGVDGAFDMTALDKLVDAALLTANARADIRDLSGVCLVAPVGVRQKRAAQHDHIAEAIADGALRNIRVAELSDRDDGHRHAEVRENFLLREVVFDDL